MRIDKFKILSTILVLLGLICSQAYAAPKSPPSVVTIAEAKAGKIAPTTQYVGTVYFAEISDVASEVAGKVLSMNVRDGQIVKKGDVLVRLSSELLDKTIANAEKILEQSQADHEYAAIQTGRITQLYKSRTVHAGEYDETRLNERALERKVEAQKALLDRWKIEKEKKTITAPYNGIILKRNVFRGEWVSQGTEVVIMALVGEYDVVFNVPANIYNNAKHGRKIEVTVNGRNYDGKILAAIPYGDVATRSFPVKVRISGAKGLAEGMEAKAAVPSGPETDAVIVPRDAVIAPRGQNVIYAVIDGKASPIPVTVIGYKGLDAGVTGPNLKPGMQVVVKGNERLRPGQPVAAK